MSPSIFILQATDSVRAAVQGAEEVASEAWNQFSDPVFWVNAGIVAIKVAALIALTLLVISLVRRGRNKWVNRAYADTTTDKKRQRILTVADLVASVARYIVWIVAIILLLSVIGIDVLPLLAGAGIAGLAVGFGAQTLIKDVISGFFLLFDDTLGYGDLLTFNGETGTVEYVGLRLIKLRKFDGELLMIPAGELRTFGNKSIGFARAIVNVSLPYEQNIDETLTALETIAGEWAKTDEAKEVMVEEAPQVQAVLDLADSAVTSRVIVQVRPGEQFPVERALRRLIKKRFDEMGIDIPFPRRTVYVHGAASPEEAAAAGAD